MIDARTSLAAAAGAAVGALTALAAVHAAHSLVEAVTFAAAAVSVAATALAAAMWLATARRECERPGGRLVVFLLFVAAGVMLAGGAHA